jgi:glycosyltransferase involved in cell wall biosynthesis
MPSPTAPDKPRLLVFVIAYYAESTLRSVLERIPPAVLDDYHCEILIVDDGSEDRTFAIGREYQAAHPELPLTVLRNEYNQGYGGNQKVGYQYAIANGFDFVAMVHGDGQYAPEKLPELLEPLREGWADAVFGSRMMTRFGALQGDMPLYKFVGNKILTFFQNRLLGTRLSEFHTGYRLYSTALLERIPFRLNSNDFHFDTEIILQLLDAGARLVELPIPTFYGDEISRVDGMKYAKDVMLATLRYRAHRAGLLYQRRYDTRRPDELPYELKLGYPSSHTLALEAVPEGSRVLEIGGQTPGLDTLLLAKCCDVVSVAPSELPRRDPRARLVVQDLDEPPRFDASEADVILLLDVLEHLRSPERFLERLRAQLDHRPRKVVLTTPNVAFAPVRGMMLLGQLNYGKSGILDLTHTRLFTFRSVLRLLRDSGFRVQRVRGVPAPFPRALGEGAVASGLLRLNQALIRVRRPLFAYQILVEATTTPDLDFVLRDTTAASAGRGAERGAERAAGGSRT